MGKKIFGGKKNAVAAPIGPVVANLLPDDPAKPKNKRRAGSAALTEGYRGYRGNTILSDVLG